MNYRNCIAGFVVAGAAAFAGSALAQGELDAMLKGAKNEPPLTVYGTVTENVLKRTADAFSAKYGLKVQYVRLAGTAIQHRYGTEAQAGTFAADVLFGGNLIPFSQMAIKN